METRRHQVCQHSVDALSTALCEHAVGVIAARKAFHRDPMTKQEEINPG